MKLAAYAVIAIVVYSKSVGAEGDRTPAPAVRAVAAAEQACKRDDAKSCTRAAELHRDAFYSGDGHRGDAKLALALFQRACELHDVAGCTGVAWILIDGTAAKPDYPRAVAILEDACRASYMPACTLLADQITPGNGLADDAGIPEDLARAMKLDEAACAVATHEGCAAGCSSLGRLYYNGWHYVKSNAKVDKDQARAAQYFDRACTAGCINSCDKLGDMLRVGDGIPRDPKRASVLYQKACDAPFSVSCASLSELYASGTGVPKDSAKATRLHARACKLSGNQVGGCSQ